MEIKNPFKERFEKKKRRKEVLLAYLLLLPLCIAAALWSEFYHVKRVRIHDAVSSQIVSISPGKELDPSNDGKLVYISDMTSTPDSLYDVFLFRSVHYIKFNRHVQFWQVVRERENQAGKTDDGRDTTITDYKYVYKWTESPGIDYHDKNAPERNKVSFKIDDTMYVAPAILLGPYRVTDGLLPAFPVEEINPLPDVDSLMLLLQAFVSIFSKDALTPSNVHRDGNTVFVGKDPSDPKVGDILADYRGVENQPVSVIAKVSGDSLVTAKIEKVPVTSSVKGLVPLDTILRDRKKEESKTAWVFRFLVFLLALGAFMLLTSPSNKLYILKGLLAAVGFSLIVISVPWILYKWFIGVPILVVGIGILVLYFLMLRGVVKVEKKEKESLFY